MKNKYIDFISDKHFLNCVGNLHNAYLRAKNNITKKNFYSNKVDIIKLTFDAKFNHIDEESLIQSEILRQIDKSINNSIGTFHEQILGGIKGVEVGNLSGFDIKSSDDTMFGLFLFKSIPCNFEDAVLEKLANQANVFKRAKCYLVDFASSESFIQKWVIENEESSVSHKRVFRISADKFYELLTSDPLASKKLSNMLEVALNDMF